MKYLKRFNESWGESSEELLPDWKPMNSNIRKELSGPDSDFYIVPNHLNGEGGGVKAYRLSDDTVYSFKGNHMEIWFYDPNAKLLVRWRRMHSYVITMRMHDIFGFWKCENEQQASDIFLKTKLGDKTSEFSREEGQDLLKKYEVKK